MFTFEHKHREAASSHTCTLVVLAYSELVHFDFHITNCGFFTLFPAPLCLRRALGVLTSFLGISRAALDQWSMQHP